MLHTTAHNRSFRLTAACAIALLLCLLPNVAHTQQSQSQQSQIKVTAALNTDTTIVGLGTTLTIQVQGASHIDDANIKLSPHLTLGQPNDRTSGFSSSIIINGQPVRSSGNQSLTRQYPITPTTPGTHTVGPITITVQGQRYNLGSYQITAVERRTNDLLRATFSAAYPAPRTYVYVGEPLPVRLDVLTPVRSNYELTSLTLLSDTPPPSIEAHTNYTSRRNAMWFLGKATNFQQRTTTHDGTNWQGVSFDAYIVAAQPGQFELGPQAIQAEITQRTGRPSRQHIELNPDRQPIIVRPLPEENKPASFTGIIGTPTLTATASPTRARVGDPITLTLSIDLPPAWRSITSPKLESLAQWAGFVLNTEPDRVTETGTTHTFEYITRIETTKVNTIPPITLSYFDTSQGTYASVTSPPIPLQVEDASIVTLADAQGNTPKDQPQTTDNTPARTLSIIPPRPSEVTEPQRTLSVHTLQQPTVLAAIIAPAALCILSYAVALTRTRSPHTSLKQRQSNALRNALAELNTRQTQGSDALRADSALRRYAADLSPAQEPHQDITDLINMLEPIDPSLAAELQSLHNTCQADRFAPSTNAPTTNTLRAQAEALLRSIDAHRLALTTATSTTTRTAAHQDGGAA